MNMPVLKIFPYHYPVYLFNMNAGGQQPIKNYEKEWKKVDDFVKKNLPKSALTEVKKIYVLAKKEKQDAQVIKSLVYMTGLQDENREDNKDSSIREIEKEIAASQEPAVSILNSLLAGMYWNYYDSNIAGNYITAQKLSILKKMILLPGAQKIFIKRSVNYICDPSKMKNYYSKQNWNLLMLL